MGWEQRGNNRYYYRKERDGSRVKSVYVGRGEIANMVSDLQSTSGLFERALSIAYPTQNEQLKDQDAKVEHACRLIDSITQASLLAGGFHLHRGLPTYNCKMLVEVNYEEKGKITNLYLGSRYDDRRHFFGRETGTFIRPEGRIQKLPTPRVLREFGGRDRHILA